jgi:hypothetical protein
MKNNESTKILARTGLTSDATRILSNARATLHGAKLRHANGSTFSAPGGKGTTSTVKTEAGTLTFLSDGSPQPGYSSPSEAAESERRLRKLGLNAMASEAELRAARKKHHMQNGMEADDADDLTRCSDDELEAKCDESVADDADADYSDDDDDDDDTTETETE